MISTEVKVEIEKMLEERVGENVRVNDAHTVHGGDINEAYRLGTTVGQFFIKLNSAANFPQMFEKEANGLKAISEASGFYVPQIIGNGKSSDHAFLLLEWIEKGTPSASFWDDFGKQLANLHQTTNDHFGWKENNYIGSLEQINEWNNSWCEFFVLNRLELQLKWARDKGRVDVSSLKNFDLLFHQLERLFPTEPPALLHGDLWSGNYMVDRLGSSVLVDPAVYYGHREIDLAMTRLFGGFNDQMYHAYQEVYPLEKDWEDRVDLCNLYPLLVHVNLFGGGYIAQAEQIIKRFI